MASPSLFETDYVQRTRAVQVNLLFLMPWVLIYHLALLSTQSPVENAAAAWLRAALRSLGSRGFLLFSLIACLLLCLVILLRVRGIAEDRGVFGGMLIEGVVYGAALGLVAHVMARYLPLGRLVDLMHDGWLGTAAEPWRDVLRDQVRDFGLAIGAGVFEEVLFRGVMMGGMFWLLRRGVGADVWTSALIAVPISAYVFSDYHHWGAFGEPYVAEVFAYRFHAGMLLGVIALTRGLGIAAFAHGFYDVLVMQGGT